MVVETAPRPGLSEIDLPTPGEWVSFWMDGKRHTLVADEPGVWTLLRHRKKAPTTLATFAVTEDWYVEIDEQGKAGAIPAPSWRGLVLRYV